MTFPDTTFTTGTTITSNWLNAVNDKCMETVSVKDFGAVGDGVTNDYQAIVNALTAAAGKTVVFESGKTYLIGSPIVFNGDVSITTDGADKAVIFHNGQSFTPLSVQGTLATTTTLSASQQVNNRGWDCTSVAGVSAGMLMEIVSNASWYCDPRVTSSDARKSELHRVGYISGTTVYSDDPANDGYNVTSGAETVTVNFYNPVSVRIENIVVRCVLPTPAVGAPARTGLQISYAMEPVLLDVDVENAASVGISLSGCYKGVVQRGHTISANAYATGYGVQILGSAHTTVRDRYFWQCRRGVDVSGANVISRHTLIENNTNLGGGVNSEGEIYGWADNNTLGAPQYGFGSHGPADHTIYRGNRVAQMHSPFNLRGRNEIVENNYIIGRTRFGAISLSYGQNYWIRNNIAYTGWTATKDNTIYEGGSNINARRCDWFVQVYPNVQDGPLVIENNDVQVQDRFVSFDTGGSGVKTVTITGGGTNFIDGEQVTIVNGTGSTALARASVSAGAVTSVSVFLFSTGFTLGEAVTITSKNNAGAGATGTVASLNTSVISKVTANGNKIRFATSSGTDTVDVFYNEVGASQNVSDWTIADNDYARVGGSGAVSLFYNFALGSSRLNNGQSYSGTYTPTVSNTVNLTTYSFTRPLRYIRVDNVVFVSGIISFTPTNASVSTELTLSLPVAAAFTSLAQASGNLTHSSTTPANSGFGTVTADTSTETLLLRFVPNSGGVAQNWAMLATYIIEN